MSRAKTIVRTWLIELSAAECAAHLAAEPLGRLGVIVDGRPEIFPLNHLYDEASGHILLATNARTKLAAALNWPWVAYEVDGLIGDDADTGWSVLVVGRAEEVVDTGEIARIAQSHVGTSAADEHTRWLRIVPDKVTGRRFTRVG